MFSSMEAVRYADPQTDDIVNKKPVFRICITGGPCSGKSTSLVKMQNILADKGWRVFTVPEAATLMMKAGIIIQNKKLTTSQSMTF